MAEVVLVKEALTPEMMAAGRALIDALDGKGWPPTSAFWFYEVEQSCWRLILSSPDVQNNGSRHAYELVSSILSEQSEPSLTLSDISVLPPRNDLVKLLSLAVRTGGVIPGIRFSRNTINGRYISDAYIYRS